MNIAELAAFAGAIPHGINLNEVVTGFATDSREVQPGNVFLAIHGAKVDGHDFIPQAMERGASAAWTTRQIDGPCLVAQDLVGSIAKFGSSVRAEFDGPVIGVTGSHGKTTTKEMIAAALSPLGEILKSSGNKNTEFTSPLVWLGLRPDTKAAVIEMGMRGKGQISHLSHIHRPTIGVVTVVGTAHIEMVGSRAGIAQAKGEMLETLPLDGTAILWADDDYLHDLKKMANCKVKTFGFSQDADCHLKGYRVKDWQSSLIRGAVSGASFEVEIPSLGRHQALNVGAAMLAAEAAGVSVKDAALALSQVQPPPMRMEIVQWNGITILLDTYNASPDSMIAALRTLLDGPGSGRRVAILGEMKELGDYAESGHREVGKVLGHMPIDEVFFTGGLTELIEAEAVAGGLIRSRIKSSPELDIELVAQFLRSARPGDIVLIKGSRSLGLERALEVQSG